MIKRVTITMDEDIYNALRIRQGELIKEFHENISYSKVINDILKKSLNL